VNARHLAKTVQDKEMDDLIAEIMSEYYGTSMEDLDRESAKFNLFSSLEYTPFSEMDSSNENISISYC